MEYKGKLYGKIGRKYFDTSHTSEDWDNMQKSIKYLEDYIKKNVGLDSVARNFHFDCWDKKGTLQTIIIKALNEGNAIIIFKALHKDLGFDPPY